MFVIVIGKIYFYLYAIVCVEWFAWVDNSADDKAFINVEFGIELELPNTIT